jgi:hypothetical protein
MSRPVFVLFGVVGNEVEVEPGWRHMRSSVVSKLHDAGELWIDTSRNGWHLGIVKELSEQMALPGLHFLDIEKHECIAIPSSKLGPTISSLSALLDALREKHIPYEAISCAWHAGAFQDYPPQDVDIVPKREIDDDLDSNEPRAAASFYCFLASLRAAATEAVTTGKRLLCIVDP